MASIHVRVGGRALVLACLLFCAAPPAFTADFEFRKDIEFAWPDGGPLKLDAYLIPGKDVHPAVIYIHGGGFVRGDKEHITTASGDIRDLIVANGISIISVNYRLAPRHPYPAATDDMQQAIAFIVVEDPANAVGPGQQHGGFGFDSPFLPRNAPAQIRDVLGGTGTVDPPTPDPTSPVPESATLTLLTIGTVLVWRRRRGTD